MTRKNIGSGTPWESTIGYSRAVRIDNHVWVAGTTATDERGEVVGAGDAAAQTRFILEKMASALAEVGASLHDVVRTRMFVTDIAEWEAIGHVHGEFFRAVRPAATMVEVARLIDPAHLIEMEMDAYIALPSASLGLAAAAET
jgi:enamine deaminase RidA (YjgF/YER057c/UK114 family)